MGRLERVALKHTHTCKIASGNSLCDAGLSGPVLRDNLEGWDGGGGGREGHVGGDIHIPMADSCCCMA